MTTPTPDPAGAEPGSIPHRRLRLNLDLEADDLDSLTSAMRIMANDLDVEGQEVVLDRTSGGYDSGYHLTVTCNPEQTGDRFREQIATWAAARRQERRMATANPPEDA